MPVPMDKLPESPLLVVPELKLRRPLTPALPALTVRIVIEPLDVDEPYPASTEMAPPDMPLPAPPAISTDPPFEDALPSAVLERPARMETMPPV